MTLGLRITAIALWSFLAAGCSGYVAVEGGAAEPVPSAPPRLAELRRDEAVDIAVEEARARGVRRISLEGAEREDNYWEIELRGLLSRGRKVEVGVKVDRWAPEVLSCKVESEDEEED